MNEADKLSREVLKRHHDDAFKWAMSCCYYDHDRARELMQLAYLEILEGRAVFNGSADLRTWLFAVLRNLASKNSRSRQSGENLLSKLKTKLLQDETYCDVSDHLAVQEKVKDIWSSIGTLSMIQRQIVELVYYRDFTLEETAKILGLRIGTARTHFHRAKKSLAKHLHHLNETR
jgi:RNA polymerase sigma-70 factor (ECF subfamily)